MRLTTVLLIASLMHVSAAGIAQRITLKKSNAPLTEVLKEIRDQSGYDIIAAGAILKVASPVTVSIKNMEIKKAMEVVLKDQDLEYSIVDQRITIREKTKTSFLEDIAKKVTDYFAAIEVRGRIVDENGKPIPGVSVKLKESNAGTISNANGEFVLRDVSENELVVFSYIGFKSLEIAAKQDLGTVRMEMSLSKLDEVQVVAYRETTGRLNTGNPVTVTAKDIEKSPVTNVLQALANRVPGLNINQTSGFNNGGFNVNIQGLNSIGKGNDPFYVIDGVPYPAQMLPDLGSSTNGEAVSNPLNFLNPMDIESVTVLKDADATAIYGSQAANGAILITTKKGKAGSTQIAFKIQHGWGTLSRGIDLMNSKEYLRMRREAIANDGGSISERDYDLNGLWDTTRYTNWRKLLIGNTAHYSDYNTSISGGSGNTSYLLGATYNRRTTVFPGDFKNQKGSVNLNVNSSSTNQRFKIQFGANYQADNNVAPSGDPTRLGILLSPVAPNAYNSDGTLNWQVDSTGRSSWPNPFAELEKLLTSKVQNLISNGMLSYEFSPGLNLKTTFGYNLLREKQLATLPLSSLPPQDLPYSKNTAVYVDNQSSGWIVEPQLSYKKDVSFGAFNLLLGTSIQQRYAEGKQFTGEGYLNSSSMVDMNAATNIYPGFSTFNEYKYFGVFGNINYNYKEKYLINLSGRRDGSSRYGAKNRFHNFWAMGLGWIFTQEPFLKNVDALSFGKLRLSYGATGNDQVGDYSFLSYYRPIPYGVAYGDKLSLGGNGITNPYLQWEETNKINFGLDLGFFDDRIVFNGSYFRNRSSNQLLNDYLPSSTGVGFIQVNLPALVQNTGLELIVNSRNIENNKFKWRTQFNLTAPKNKLVRLEADENSYTYLVVGQSLTVAQLYKYAGVDPQTGLYTVLGSDGVPTSNPDEQRDRTVMLDLAPKIYGGIENSFSYRSFEFSFLFSFVRRNAGNGLAAYPTGLFPYNVPTYFMDRWRNPGDQATYQRYSADGSALGAWGLLRGSDKVFSNGDYARLKNVSLSWYFPQNFQNKLRLSNGRIFFQAQNLLTITRFPGLDPELAMESLSALPPMKVLTLGIQASF